MRMSKTRGWISEPQTILDQSRGISQVNQTTRYDLGYHSGNQPFSPGANLAIDNSHRQQE